MLGMTLMLGKITGGQEEKGEIERMRWLNGIY